MTLSEKINRFNQQLQIKASLPENVEVLNPFRDSDALELSSRFYQKYYNDEQPRKLILGINPGRFGAGVTGVPFTDPVKLQEVCRIKNDLKKSTEPSAGFIYDMIDAWGGPRSFYKSYFIHAVCPLGFTRDGVNYNYYDDKNLENAVTPFIIDSLKQIIAMGFETEVCYCLGNGKNFKYLKDLNDKKALFGEVIPLPHPRWIVQYRKKRYTEFIALYLDTLK